MYNDYRTKESQGHLAWHETLELHELTAFQSNQLIHFKMVVGEVTDPGLKQLYMEAIKSLETNLKELLPYFQQAPVWARSSKTNIDLTAFYAGQLLIFAKTAVRTYAIAITETSTPQLRDLLQKQLNAAIALHGKIFQFMLQRGFYPSYDLQKLLANDVANANKALSL